MEWIRLKVAFASTAEVKDSASSLLLVDRRGRQYICEWGAVMADNVLVEGVAKCRRAGCQA